MLRKIFESVTGGRKEAPQAEPEIAAREEYGGFELRAAPVQEGNVWRVAGTIAKTGAEPSVAHDFIRADTCASHDDAVQTSLRKAKQIVDEQGDTL